MMITLGEWAEIDLPTLILLIVMFVIDFLKLRNVEKAIREKTGPTR